MREQVILYNMFVKKNDRHFEQTLDNESSVSTHVYSKCFIFFVIKTNNKKIMSRVTRVVWAGYCTLQVLTSLVTQWTHNVFSVV